MASTSSLFSSSTGSQQQSTIMEDASMTSSQLVEALLVESVDGEESNIQQASDESTVSGNYSVLSQSDLNGDMKSLEQIQQRMQQNQQTEHVSVAGWSSSIDTTMGEVLSDLEKMSISKGESPQNNSSNDKKSNEKSVTMMDVASLPLSQGSSDIVREWGGGKSVAVDSMLSDPTKFPMEMDDFVPLSTVMPLGSEMDIDPSVASQLVYVQVGKKDKSKKMTISDVLKMMQSETTSMIHELNFTNALINNGDVQPIVLVLEQASKTNTLIRRIYHRGSMTDDALYRNYYVGHNGATALANTLEQNPPLLILDLGFNEIGVEGANALATALATNTTLQKLFLHHNSIGDEGAKALAKALETNITLHDLDLKDNQIGYEGAEALANALETNTTLQELNLNDNSIGDEGATVFLPVTLYQCHEIESLVEQNFSPSKQERIYIDETEITDMDVVGGNRSTGSSHPGNRMYRQDVDRLKPTHLAEGGMHGTCRNEIINNVIERGGSFVKEKNGRFYLLTRKEAEHKVAQALKPRKSRAKTTAE